MSKRLYNKACFGCWANKSNSSSMKMTGVFDFEPDFNKDNKYDNDSANDV
jgi:hypothetical protein